MTDDNNYDLIVVGSGNGACGFLSYYLDNKIGKSSDEKILVLEEGEHFFNSSDIAHQLNWLKSFSEENIFKLHNALTPDKIPIISGRACTMGGGGSINYTMIHESSDWLANHIGYSVDYWNDLKAELNKKFALKNPETHLSPVTQQVIKLAEAMGFEQWSQKTENIPNHPEKEANLLHLFPTPFNSFGQRTHSGVSLVNWEDTRVELKTLCRVLRVELSEEKPIRCVAVQVKELKTGKIHRFCLKNNGRIILCAGATTPKLLLSYRETFQNKAIGLHVSDHILLPLGIYLADKENEITPKDNYIPVFATTIWKPEQQGRITVCTFDFFAGKFERLLFLLSHLFLALLLPNCLKKLVIRVPWLFTITKNIVRRLIASFNFFIKFFWGIYNLFKGKSWPEEVNLVTAIIKFKPASDGYYSDDGNQIILDFFAKEQSTGFNQDKQVATTIITKQMKLLNSLGNHPHCLVKFLIRLLTHIPYEETQVADYVDTYRKKFLLTEQHLAGGCLFGKAIDPGLENSSDTGKLYGSANIYVADLSAVPLPRISPQMTAYLIGFHVAKRLCS
ncbi:MAG: GMC oxidoreductase [Crocosphaera sp.]|nr:GMC oxidoreductase [Crocosphaera sp.]